MSKKNIGSYKEKEKKAKALINNPNNRDVIRHIQEIPYFDSVFKRCAIVAMYIMLLFRMDDILLWILSCR